MDGTRVLILDLAVGPHVIGILLRQLKRAPSRLRAVANVAALNVPLTRPPSPSKT